MRYWVINEIAFLKQGKASCGLGALLRYAGSAAPVAAPLQGAILDAKKGSEFAAN
jgi:hypothetical protein